MSVFDKLSKTVDEIKSFDEEKPIVTIESDSYVIIENYQTIRLFTDTQIEIYFDKFVLGIIGNGLVIKKFSPAMIKITGKVSSITYTV